MHPADLAVAGGSPRPLGSGRNVACDTRGQKVCMTVCGLGPAPVSREIIYCPDSGMSFFLRADYFIVYLRVFLHHGAHVEVRGQLDGLFSSFCCVGPEIQSRVPMLCS